MKIKVIITGATGMVGEGVLHQSLNHPDVESVLVINRKPCGVNHPKLKEIIHKDFFDLSKIRRELNDYNACFYCLGITSINVKEAEYSKITYDMTLNFAKTIHELNPELTFCYVSGLGTDSSESSKIMWARVKGKIENALFALFNKAYMFRPGYIQPIKGMKHTHKFYKLLVPLYPILTRIFPSGVCTLEELANSMLNCVKYGHARAVLEVKDIRLLGNKN